MGARRIEVLRGISMEIAHNEAVFLSGASGAGKTTLLYTLAGMGHRIGNCRIRRTTALQWRLGQRIKESGLARTGSAREKDRFIVRDFHRDTAQDFNLPCAHSE